MARKYLLIYPLAVGAMLLASPLASADHVVQAPAASGQLPELALGANQLAGAMCGKRDALISELQKSFSEAPMAVGQVDANAVVEIFASDEGSWTILATGTDGVSCIISAGQGFESTLQVRGTDI